MNATARALAAGTFNGYNLRNMIFSFESIIAGILLMASLITSFAVIYIKDEVRQQATQLHSLQYQHDQMIIEQGKLLLEQNTWSSPIRVQNIAETQLNMSMPSKNIVVFIA